MTNIVFDIGGTNTRVAAVAGDALGEVVTFPTDPDPDEGMRRLVDHARTLTKNAPIGNACGCVAGTVVEGVIVGANNLVLWNGTFIAEGLKDRLGVPVAVLNDAELAGMGEYRFGAGQGLRSFLYVTVSTGVGKARIVDGVAVYEGDAVKLVEELADQLDLEHMVSGTAVKNRYGVDPKHLTDENVRNDLAAHLARGLKSSVDNFSPEALILGGSMILGNNALPLGPLHQAFPNLTIKKAALGDHSGLYGGLAYLQRT